MRPVEEVQFSGFTMQAFDQIEQNMARFRNRSRARFPISMVLRTPYGGGIRAVEHHSESREAYWAHTPGLKVVIPSGPRNAYALLHAAINDPDPVVFYEPKAVYRAFREEVPDGYAREHVRPRCSASERREIASRSAIHRYLVETTEDLLPR